MDGVNLQRLAVEKVRAWVSGPHVERAVWLVSDYYTQFRGRRFDELAGSSPAHAMTETDLDAVRALSIGFPRAFVQSLTSEPVQRQIRGILGEIPTDAVLEDLSAGDFDQLLGPRSRAWAAWDYLAASLKEDRARAPLVGASKLLAAKRPRLVPLEDGYVRRALGSGRYEIWQVIHGIVQDVDIRAGLAAVRQQVPGARHVTVHRVLDVIAWREQQGHCCGEQGRVP